MGLFAASADLDANLCQSGDMGKPRRFEVIHKEKKGFSQTEILRDRETGVCYLCRAEGMGVGLTPLLGSGGAVVVEQT